VPGEGAHPRAPAVGPEGRVWFFDEGSATLVLFDDIVGRFHRVRLPTLPGEGTVIRSIAVDHARLAAWVAPGGGGAIVRIEVGEPQVR
jgi:streptogramin lyase